MKRIIVGISGATGVVYVIRLLEILYTLPDVEVHLIVSQAAKQTIMLETSTSYQEIKQLAAVNYDVRDIAAAPSSGSFQRDAMVILPCSIKTLSAVANSYCNDLLVRSADVCLKERVPLILGVRETPFHLGHLKLMQQAAEMGAIIMPPLPAFYNKPTSLEHIIDHTVNRFLDLLNIKLNQDLIQRWGETKN